MKRDSDPPTPVGSKSGAFPLLQSVANELIVELGEVRTFDALHARRKLRAIVAVLESWGGENQPTREERRVAIEELVQAVKTASGLLPKK